MAQQNDPTQRLYPRARRTGLKQKSHVAWLPSDLTPLPALETLAKRRSLRDELADQPTMPLRPLIQETCVDIARLPTQPLAQEQGRFHRLASRRTRKNKAGNKSKGEKANQLPPRAQERRRRRRMRRSCLLVLLMLLALVVFGGLFVSGLYFTETNVLAPLAKFFHPLGGETDGSIDGRAWNMLLLGSDNDQKFVFPALLTQVMMVVHVDPLNNKVSMVSIPRDSWVPVPGMGMYKIDQAFLLGASPRHNFDDGVRLARQTIEQDYGIPIDRYGWIGLAGFSSVINTLGGVDIDVTHPLLDDNYPDDTGKGTSPSNPYAVRRLYIPPGPQHLTGDQALQYVRSRHADLVGDIGRTQRQQEVLESLKKKLNASTIFNHLTELFHDLTGKVYTDLSQSEMLSVANFARNLPASSIYRLTLAPGHGNQNYGTLAQTSDLGLDNNQDIILPNCATIQPAINRIFDLGDAQSCQVSKTGG